MYSGYFEQPRASIMRPAKGRGKEEKATRSTLRLVLQYCLLSNCARFCHQHFLFCDDELQQLCRASYRSYIQIPHWRAVDFQTSASQELEPTSYIIISPVGSLSLPVLWRWLLALSIWRFLSLQFSCTGTDRARGMLSATVLPSILAAHRVSFQLSSDLGTIARR
jgi:hypothetical protein